MKSAVFRKSLFLLLAMTFGVVGALQLVDFFQEAKPGMLEFSLLSFFASVIFFYLYSVRSKTKD